MICFAYCKKLHSIATEIFENGKETTSGKGGYGPHAI
jgi:hypothetical protein